MNPKLSVNFCEFPCQALGWIRGKIQGPGSRCSNPALPLPLASAHTVLAERRGAARSVVIARVGRLGATFSAHATTTTVTAPLAFGADRASHSAIHAESVAAGAKETADAGAAL